MIPLMALPLHSPSANYSAEDRAGFAPALRVAIESAAAPRAHDPGARLALTEALLMLTACPTMSDMLATSGVYPLLREAHRAEESGDVKEVNERLVQSLLKSSPMFQAKHALR